MKGAKEKEWYDAEEIKYVERKKIDEVDSGKVGGCSAPHLPPHHPPGLEHPPPLHWPPEQSAVHLQSPEKISKRATYPTTTSPNTDSNSILPATPSFKRMVASPNPTKTPTLGSRGPACTFLKKCLYILHHHYKHHHNHYQHHHHNYPKRQHLYSEAAIYSKPPDSWKPEAYSSTEGRPAL